MRATPATNRPRSRSCRARAASRPHCDPHHQHRRHVPENQRDHAPLSLTEGQSDADLILAAREGLAKLFRKTPVATWRAYLTFHYLNTMADVLPKEFDDAAFAFNGRAVTGQPQQRDRWKRAVSAMSGTPFSAALGEAVGQLYVRRNFSPESKAAMRQLVENLRAAFRVRIAKLPWMTDETRKAALRKLEKMNVKIGYPDKWRDYSTLDIKPGDAIGNRKRENAFNRARDLMRLAQGVDRSEWNMAPQTVSAYYNSVWNEIVFPAAILQPPFFDLAADSAVNYGGIGAVIGPRSAMASTTKDRSRTRTASYASGGCRG
jgi:putative endopeptidase